MKKDHRTQIEKEGGGLEVSNIWMLLLYIIYNDNTGSVFAMIIKLYNICLVESVEYIVNLDETPVIFGLIYDTTIAGIVILRL